MHSFPSSTIAEDHGLLYCALVCGSLLQLFKGGIHRELKQPSISRLFCKQTFSPLTAAFTSAPYANPAKTFSIGIHTL